MPDIDPINPISEDRISKIIERHEAMRREKAPWLPLYEILGEFVMTRKQHFVSEGTQGEVQNAKLFDETGQQANHLMASSLIGALWPNGAKSIQILPPADMADFEEDTADVKKYYNFVTRKLTGYMDLPESGFLTSLEEYMLDQGAFGISGIGVYEQDDDYAVPIIYKSVDAKQITIDEGPNGFVDTVYIEKIVTIRQAVREYGYDSLSDATQKAFDKGAGSDKLTILVCVEPRIERDPYGFGVQNYPVASIHIEKDKKRVIKESGFYEMPIYVPRFWKAMSEKYGRSPGMNALPDILEVNALREALIIATEKQLDPPLGVLDDGTLGNGTIDTSAGAINVISISGRLGTLGRKPIEPLYTVGELNSCNERIIQLQQSIENNFFKDRLLDLNNETRMTLGEANIRNKLRGESLGTIYARQIAELFKPCIKRTFNILLRKGLLGVVEGSKLEETLLAKGVQPIYIPEAVARRIASGQDVYEIKFISPASRIMQVDELNGITQTLEVVTPLAGISPESLDVIDLDVTIGRIVELTGAPESMVRASDNIKKIRDTRAQMQQAQAQAEAERNQSETVRNIAQAHSTVNNVRKAS